MEFTKEEAREKITAAFSKKVEKIADWERTIKENVDTLWNLLGEENDITLDSFVEKSLPLLETANGLMNKKGKTVATNFEAQIDELKKKIEAYEKKSDPPKEENGVQVEGVKELMERIQRLEEERAEEQKSKTLSDKRDGLFSKIKEKGVKDDEWISLILSKAAINEETDIEKEAESYVEIYNKSHSETPPGVTPKKGGGTNSDRIKEIVKQAGEMNKNLIL